jgi:predicted nuclease of predicted toxin-antitoxin system
LTVRFLADENIDSALVLGLKRRVEAADIVRVQDVGLRTRDDPAILEWAAGQGRSLISHDIKTIPGHALERIAVGLPMPGVFLLRATLAIAVAIDELALIAEASDAADWDAKVIYLPLR